MKHCIFFTVVALMLIPSAAWTREGDPDELAQDRNRIQGTWSVLAYDQDGKPLPPEIVSKMSVSIQAATITIKPKVTVQRTITVKDDKRQAELKFTTEAGKSDVAKYCLDVAKKRKVIELTQEMERGPARVIQGLYALDGDALTICLPLPDRKLPNKVPNAPKPGFVRLVLKRINAGQESLGVG